MYRGVVGALELKMDKATLASERARGNKVFLTFKVVSTPQATLPLGTPVTLCLMTNVQTNSNCAVDPATRSTTTVRIGDIASLPLEYFLDNSTWPDPYTLTSVRVGIDYSINANAGIYLSNATSPFVSIVTGSYVANSTSVTNANAGKNVADTAISFSYDTYLDEASRAMGLGSTPASFAGAPTTPTYLPAVAYPFATSTATTSLNKLSNATTTTYTEYTPFGGYTSDTRGFTTTDISINGNVVARYVYTPASSSSPATSTLTYVHTSYLGTPVLETNSKGDIVYIALTDINGNTILRDERNDSTLQNKLYTGHRYDNVTGLTYAHARYLDTRTHTFTTVDPLYYQLSSAQLYSPQLQNAYSYANNNPVSNTDPTGLSSVYSAWNSIKSAVSSAVATVGNGLTAIGNGVLSAIYNPVNTYNNVKANGPTVVKALAASAYNSVASLSNMTPASQVTNFLSTSLGGPSTLSPLANASNMGISPQNLSTFAGAMIVGDVAIALTPTPAGKTAIAEKVALKYGVSVSEQIGMTITAGSFGGLKKELAKYAEWNAGDGALHHVVMQMKSNVKEYGAKAIHSTDNLVFLPHDWHSMITTDQISKGRGFSHIYDYYKTLKFEKQTQMGWDLINKYK